MSGIVHSTTCAYQSGIGCQLISSFHPPTEFVQFNFFVNNSTVGFAQTDKLQELPNSLLRLISLKTKQNIVSQSSSKMENISESQIFNMLGGGGGYDIKTLCDFIYLSYMQPDPPYLSSMIYCYFGSRRYYNSNWPTCLIL